MPNENMDMIIFHLNEQQNLLQSYRSVAVTHQALTAAIVMVMISVIENYDSIPGFFDNNNLSSIMIVILLMTLQAVVILYGKMTTDIFKEQTEKRERNVSILQHLMKIEESGYLKEKLSLVGINTTVPLSSIFQLIGNKCKNASPDSNHLIFTEDQIEAIKDLTKPPKNKISTRLDFSKSVFQIFYIIWAFGSVYSIIRVFFVMKLCIDYISNIC
ncbi:MAG: hypothetical protein LWW93_07640 [Hyphomicrobiales bacterium]|nr:hypothetical protein [Hyphomicrobiales bacterium]